uniref:Putative ixodes 10 kDa peptide protein n=1 Tax=Ixodes ricinus TaxID=34613 RepID=A0A0K8RD40_IXORI
MLLVLFAVVLILPAFEVEGERHRRATPDLCYSRFYGAADIWCRIHGHGGFQRYYSGCQVRCKDGTNLALPEWVCPPCKTGNEYAVSKWKEDLEKKEKGNLLEAWCPPVKCY